MRTGIVFNVSMSSDFHREFKAAAASAGITMNELALDAIDSHLEKLAQEDRASLERYRRILANRTPEDNEALRRHNEKIAADPAVQEIERRKRIT